MELTGKKTLVVGAARSGIAAAKFLLARGAQVTISDQRPLAELKDAAELGAATIEAGGHQRDTFLAQDLIVASPGVPWNNEHLAAARDAGIEVIGEAELASRFLQGKLVGITGSNGKTTTTALAGKHCEAAGFHTQVGGNIGTPLISLVDTSRPETYNIVELSSFQLESIRTLRCDIAMVLNITPDHLDRHGDFIGYAKAKARIMENQRPDDIVVLNADDETCRAFAMAAKSRVLLFSRAHEVAAGAWLDGHDIVFSPGEYSYTVMDATKIPLKGAHNVENVLAALCGVLSQNPDPKLARDAVMAFKGVEHRLEFVAKIRDVEYYNDSKATNVDATIKALEAFDNKLLVILGGKDKDSDYTPLKPLLKEKARAAYLIGTASEKIATQLDDVVPLIRSGTLDIAVREAARKAKAGDTVLLAPACASFDQFRNFEHRGEVFKQLVKGLQH